MCPPAETRAKKREGRDGGAKGTRKWDNGRKGTGRATKEKGESGRTSAKHRRGKRVGLGLGKGRNRIR